MKTFFKALTITLILTQVLQAKEAEKYTASSEQGAAILKALELSPDNKFTCTRSDSQRVQDYHAYLSTLLRYVDRLGAPLITQYDAVNPLIITESSQFPDKLRIQFYSDSRAVEVVQVVMQEIQRKEINRGTLAKPNVVFEDQILTTTTCKKISK